MKWYICYLLLFLCTANAQKNSEKQGSSMFASLLRTLSSSDYSTTCPGRCFNAIAALACQEVIDEPGLCSTPGYRCCKNVAQRDETADEEEEVVVELPEVESSTTVQEIELEDGSDEGSVTELPTLVELDDNDVEEAETETPMAEEKMDKEEPSPQQYSSSQNVKVCPGVCVAERISKYCEAILNVQGLCKTRLRCCVPANLFDGVDHPPKEFVVLNPSSGNDTNKEQGSAPSTTPTTTTSTSTTSTSTTSRRTTTIDFDVKSSGKDDKSSLIEDSNIPPEKKCKGTCVAGFFAFLCDSIDRTGECPSGGRCCVTQRKSRPKPGDKVSATKEGTPPPRTTKKPRRTTTTTTTTTRRPPITTTTVRPQLATTESRPPPPCIGTCLPVSIASRCQAPSRLVVASGCRDDEICCDDRGKAPSPTKRPGSQMPQALDTILSLFGGSSGGQRPPPPPPRRTAPPTTTTTTTTSTTTTPAPTTIVTEKPDCPGTCIVSLLSFTCFANAEMTDLFKCEKEKQSCCAPKSAIRKLNGQNEMNNNIARNDTVYTGQYNPYYGNNYGHPDFNPYEQPHYTHNPYEQPNFINQNFGQPSEENFEHHYYQQEHPEYQTPQYEHPSYEDLQKHHPNYPHFNQAPPEHITPPQHPPFNIAENAQFNQQSFPQTPTQNQQNFNQDHDARQPFPPQATPPSHPVPPPSSSVSPNLPFPGAGKPHVDNKYVCGVKGVNRAARVVGGEDSVPGEWCWQVALINSLNQYLCGGALIGTQWVLTAAHCVTNIVRSGDAIYVRVGDHDLTTRFGSPGAQTLPVATTYIHHNHNSQTLDNDIALLKLSSHAELGNGVCLACLPARGVSQVAGKRCTVTGYGYMGETGPIPLRVREAEIPVVSDNECVRKINAVTEKIFILPASSFCAGGESGHDACQGDGGGPLVCNVDGYYELSGLVSWGFGCGRQDVPGVYVKVASFIGWVNQIISVNNL